MAFDPVRYEKEVIGPLRGRHGRLPDGDLSVRYAIVPGMSAADIEAHLKALRSFWNQKANGNAAQAATKVCKQLLAADEEWKRSAGRDMTRPDWWQKQSAAYRQRAKPALDRLVTDLRDAGGGFKRITKSKLAAIVGAQSAVLDQKQIDAAISEAGIQIVEPVTLPDDSGLDRTAYKNLLDSLAVAGIQGVVHLIHPGLTTSYELVPAFRVAAQPGLGLGEAQIKAQLDEAEKAAFSPAVAARKTALGVLRTGLRSGRDPSRVALYQIVERMREGRAQGLSDELLVRKAAEFGLDPSNAETLVLSLPAVAAPVSPTARIGELIAAGQLRTAQQMLGAVPLGNSERQELKQQLDAVEATVTGLLADASEAVARHREDEAARLLRRAAQLAADDESVAARLRDVPPSPPRDLRVGLGSVTSLSWSVPLSGQDNLRYRVMRSPGGPPSSPQSGVVVAQTHELTAADADPPVGMRTGYAVFAATDAGVWSRAAASTVTIAPGVESVLVQALPAQVTVSWKVHPAAVAVRVRRTENRPPASPADGVAVPSTVASFTDADIRQGVDYFYSLVAVYRDDRLNEIAAEMVLISAAPRPPARAIEGMLIEPLEAGEQRSRVRISWPEQPGVQVRIRRAATMPGWQAGTEIAVEAVGGYGEEVAGQRAISGGMSILEAEVPPGFHVYVGFAVGGNGAVVGRPVVQGLASPVRQLQAERTGDHVALSWVWPDDVGVAEVTWSPQGAPKRAFRITRHQYQAESGCRVVAGIDGGAASVVAVTAAPLGEARSPAVHVVVEGRSVRVSYTVKRAPGLRNLVSRKRVVSVVAERSCRLDHLLVVLRPGQVLPLRAEQGQEIARFSDLILDAGTPVELELELPRTLSSPAWIRCFADPPGGVSLAHVDVDQLKV